MSLTNLVLAAAEKQLEEKAKRVKVLLRQEVHVKSGALRDSIEIKKKGRGEYFIGVNASKLQADPRNIGGLDYSRPYHDGHRPYTIVPVRAKALRWVGKDGKVHFATKVRIPAHSGDPFVQRAAMRFKRGG